jgi:HEAT repeat protein
VKQRLRDEFFAILQTADASPWRDAALCIAALQGQRVNEFFPRALREGPVPERQRAALAMGRVGAPDWATVPLLGALDRRVPQPVRSQAAWALGQMKDRKAVQPLMAVLREDPELANEAANALGVIGEPAVPPLTAALSSDDAQVRQMAVKSLGKMGVTALRPLLQIVQDEKQTDQVVKSAAEALGLLGDPQALPALVTLLRARRGKLAEPAAHALAGIGAPAVQSLIEALPAHSAELELRQAIVTALVSIGLPSIPALTRALNSSSTAIRAATEDALTRIGAPANQALLQALRGGDLNLRRRIAEILENTGDVGLAEPLVRMLGDKEQDSGVRVRAMHILAQVGREQAVDPLIEAMQKDPDEVVRREAVRTLMDIKSERSVGPLIDMLQDAMLRDQATAALSAIGDPAVEALILAINEGRDTGLRQAAIKALSAIGARGRVGEPTLSALACVYSQLFTEQLTPDALVALLENMRWWKHGEELYQAFNSAQILAHSQNLSEVAQSRETLAWVEAIDKPFRPGIKEILEDLNRVAQDAAIYLSNPDRGGQRDAMVSTIDRLTGIQQTIDTQLLEFEKGPFTQVVEGWRRLTEEAIKNLRGRAQLAIETIRDDVVLDSGSVAGTVVFSLTNTGDSAARNLSVTLKRGSKDGFEVMGSVTQRLEPLGTGMQKQVEFSIKPLGVEQTTYALEVSYDDDEAEDRFYPVSGQLRFHAIDLQYRPIPNSPYNWGLPIKTRQMFYGRQDVFDWIAENISSLDQPNILILHGERRMGKTSILYQLGARPPSPQHVCVFFSLELASTRSAGDLLLDLALAIREQLAKVEVTLPKPSEEDLMSNAQRAFRHYYYKVVEPALGERRLLIMVDEFDILLDKVDTGVLSEDTLHFLRGLMQHSNKIAFIVTGAHKVREMLKDGQSILFNIARAYKISYLGRAEAEALIVEPVAQHLNYDDLTVRTIVEVTAGHPYFIQYICDSLVKLAQKLKKNWMFKQDVQVVLQDIIQDSSGILQNAVFAPLSEPEKKVLAALANVTDENRIYVLPETVAQKLEQNKLSVSRKELLDALRSLRERDLVVEQRSGQSLLYGFNMGLIRMWLCQNDVLLRLSQEMRK